MKSKRIILFLVLILCFQHNTIVAGVETIEKFDFKKLETSGRWFIVNDGVMGGVSESNVSWEPEGFLVFEGFCPWITEEGLPLTEHGRMTGRWVDMKESS